MRAPRTCVYVDGFNLYCKAVKGTPYKWLNVAELCRELLPRNDILEIVLGQFLSQSCLAEGDLHSRRQGG